MKILMNDLDDEIKKQALENAKARVEKAEPITPIVSADSVTLPTGKPQSSPDGKQDKGV